MTNRWNNRYLERDTPWDQGGPSVTVMRMADRALAAGSRVVVPGSGPGWQVEALARRGHAVTALDLAPEAIRLLGLRLDPALPVTLRVGDLLHPSAEQSAALDGTFDGVAEHTCFCAIDPEHRPTYVERVAALLRPGGALFGAFLDFEGGGPPHGTNADELERLFGDRFEFEVFERAPEAYGRSGRTQIQAVFRRR